MASSTGGLLRAAERGYLSGRWSGASVTTTLGVPTDRAHRGYRHEALVYRGLDGFLDVVVPFIRDGVLRGQPVMVAVVPRRIEALRAALGSDADAVHFVDMAELGANPARIIPAWRDFIDRHSADRQPIRGVGEPIWVGRRSTEIAEAQFHEALLNVAVCPDTPLWLICPYDADAMPAEVIEEAYRSHPAIVDHERYRGSTTYGGAYHVGDLFGRELPAPGGPVRNLVSTGDDGYQVADWVRRWAEASGLSVRRSGRLAAVIRSITQSVSRPGHSEVLQLWQEGSTLICQVTDSGRVQDPLIGRRPPADETPRGRALRDANEICDLVQVRSGPAGTTVRMHTRLT